MSKSLSICIPVYNTSVVELVEHLLAGKSDAVKEILLFDDGSEEKWKKENRALEKHPLVVYREMPENLGRARIRNMLGKAARGEVLLFLDDDGMPVSNAFLERYAKAIRNHQVVCGGRRYPTEVAPLFALHYEIGVKSESKEATVRNRKPYQAFHSNNFAVERALFLNIQFDESLTQYGHEDTLFGYALSRKKSQVLHIDNPVWHTQLQTNEEFVGKAEWALQNLKMLYEREGEAFAQTVTLLRVYARLRRWKLVKPMVAYYRMYGKTLRASLLSEKASVSAFNLYKLAYWCHLMQKG